jgi:hypothetical protein
MGLFPPDQRRVGLKVAALAIVLCAGASIAWMLRLRGPGHKITDQELLREAVTEWKLAGEPGTGPNYQIFEQQAVQGYYEDAAATGRLYKRADDVQWSIVELAKIRTENGDIQGAKDQIKRFSGSDLGTRAAKVIALTQAHNGDLPGSLETIGPLGDSNEVRLVFGQRQIANGDFDGALKTAEQMDSQSADQAFYGVGDALRDRGEQKRVPELASHMSDRKMAALFVELARFTFRPREIETIEIVQPGPCDIAYHGTSDGNFAEVDALIEQNKCSYVSFVATQQYAVDPAGAERLLRRNANPQDLNRGLAEFAVAAAKRGEIAEALRFLDNLQSLNGPGNAYRVVHEIARAWTIRDGPKAVLQWARSRPNTDERTWALIGIAEALGHARPQR